MVRFETSRAALAVSTLDAQQNRETLAPFLGIGHESMIRMASARFSTGDVVQHKLFNYRGVIVGVDTHFRGTEAWYEAVARSRPPRHRPWYHVLPHGAQHQTYVAERNLEPDYSGLPRLTGS